MRIVSTWRSPRRRETLIPSIRNCRDSSISLMNGINTRKCFAMGGRVGISWKYLGPSRCVCRLAWRSSSCRRVVAVAGSGCVLGLDERGERKAYER